MDAAVMDRNTHRQSYGAAQPPPHSRGPVYYPTPAAPASRSVSSKRCSNHQPDRPQHPSLNRVKGRINMYTPPRTSTEISWLNDQSPIDTGTRTPLQCKTPDHGTPTLVHPASTLLQDLLKEQRAHRGSRSAASADWEDDSGPRTPEGSRIQEDSTSEKARKMNDTFSAGQRKPREMGMREMDQYVSKMNKLNFDLKLEVFHRTQQVKTLEKRLERVKEMEEELEQMHTLQEEVQELRTEEKDNQNLRQSNEQLRKELDKRDQAISEAVELICQLESKIDQLETGGTSQMSMVHNAHDDGSNVSTPKTQMTAYIPERNSSKRDQNLKADETCRQPSEPRQLNRAPSFLRVDSKSTATLRSLYTSENNLSRGASSELTKSESLQTMNEATEPESPQLSVLSECSELNPFDSPSKWSKFDQLEIPIRRVSSTTGSVDSFDSPSGQEESKESQIDRWMESRPEMSQTIITRRRHRATSDASQAGTPSFENLLYSKKNQSRPRLDTALFGGDRLPPTPDTMSTAYAVPRNGSNGSIVAEKSPQPELDPWSAVRRLDRRRSAGELTSRRNSGDSEITDSMQAFYGDTPRLGMTISESPTIYPFNTVAFKASKLLGPGSPNNPRIESFGDFLQQDAKTKTVSPQVKRHDSPPKAVTPKPRSKHCDYSPPLTPQDWLAAAKLGPRSRKERADGEQHDAQQTESPACSVFSQAVFHDDGRSILSASTQPDLPTIPTLDPDALESLHQPLAELDSESRRRLSFRPPYFNGSTEEHYQLESSPMAADFDDFDDFDDDEGAPPPNVPKTRKTGSASRRPISQLMNTGDMYSSSVPNTSEGHASSAPKGVYQAYMESRMPTHNATISGWPTTSHSMEHKRRSSLGIFGWMKGVGGKRSEPTSPYVADKSFNSPSREQRTPSRLTHEVGGSLMLAGASTPTSESMDTSLASPCPDSTLDDYSRRPRYIGRRTRRG